MTLKVLILLVRFGSVSAMGYSQDQKMSVNFHDEMLGNVLEFLKSNSDYEFVYRTEILGDLKVKSVELKDATLKQVWIKCYVRMVLITRLSIKSWIVRKLAMTQQKKEIKISGKVNG